MDAPWINGPDPEPEIRHCGEVNGRFYDRDGCFFRDGVDPRNYYGRLVRGPELGCTHDQDCEIHLGDCSLTSDEPWVC